VEVVEASVDVVVGGGAMRTVVVVDEDVVDDAVTGATEGADGDGGRTGSAVLNCSPIISVTMRRTAKRTSTKTVPFGAPEGDLSAGVPPDLSVGTLISAVASHRR